MSVIVPIYLARLGYSATKLSVMFAIVAITSAGMSLMIGLWSDRVGRRPFVIAVPLGAVVAAVVFILTDNIVLLFTFAALGSFGRGSGAGSAAVGPYQPAEQALIAGTVDDRDRPRLFGLVASASATGGLLGAALAASPIGAATGVSGVITTGTYRAAFIAAAVLAMAAALAAVPVRERPRADALVGSQSVPEQSDEVPPPVPAGRGRLSSLGRSIVLRPWAVNVTNGIAVGMFGPFVTY